MSAHPGLRPSGERLTVVATLFDPSTNRRVEVQDDIAAEYADNQEFMWTEGNYSCDCNKRLFIARALGNAEPDDDKGENPCGDDIKLERLVVAGEVVIGKAIA